MFASEKNSLPIGDKFHCLAAVTSSTLAYFQVKDTNAPYMNLRENPPIPPRSPDQNNPGSVSNKCFTWYYP